ncbi:hypothetical protein [Streptomyces sp. 891-h]|uniref:hypothetical protein n=1 Tax=unclassified Streptomyces TaxID=2593676 RepID=UPI001FAA78F9|nr:hypothetical protein [Streptomyces sp. 891-h]UNZ21101.1 hypothetical protein HC362_32490 [Streptomyces sp. 891-h]
MMHHELQAARQAAFLTRAAQRRLVREAERAAKAARSGVGSDKALGSDDALGADDAVAADSRTHRFRAA